MTDLHDRETLTQPIAARRCSPTVYDVNATTILRPNERPIFDFRYAPPTGGAPAMFTAGPDAWALDDMLQDPPTGPVPPLPPPPPTPGKAIDDDVYRVRRAFFEPGRRRSPDSPRPIPARWAWGLIAYAAGLVSGAALLGSVLAAVIA